LHHLGKPMFDASVQGDDAVPERRVVRDGVRGRVLRTSAHRGSLLVLTSAYMRWQSLHVHTFHAHTCNSEERRPMTSPLLLPYDGPHLKLPNRIVMAPMTRGRADD